MIPVSSASSPEFTAGSMATTTRTRSGRTKPIGGRAMPGCRAASILAWPAISPPSSPTSAGVVQPHSLMLAAIAAI